MEDQYSIMMLKQKDLKQEINHYKEKEVITKKLKKLLLNIIGYQVENHQEYQIPSLSQKKKQKEHNQHFEKQ